MAEYAVYSSDPSRKPHPAIRSSQVGWPARLTSLNLSDDELDAARAAIDKAKPALLKTFDELFERKQRFKERLSEQSEKMLQRVDRYAKSADDMRLQILNIATPSDLRKLIENGWDNVEWSRHALQLESDSGNLFFAGQVSLTDLLSHVDMRARAQLLEHTCLRGGGAIDKAASSAMWALDRLVPIGPFRQPASRVYSYSGTAPGTVGRGGEMVPELLHQNDSAVSRVNEWFQRFAIRYQLHLKQLGGKTRSDIFELRLRDKARGSSVEVAFNDVGFGISQMLPIIVQSVASEKKIITIEQPEVHIHPRLQAEIGDLLVETMQTNGHQFLVETHSEHLILRLRKLVREKKLKPQDLCVLHVSRGKHGAEVQRIHVGDDGSFLDEWPGGFFPERLRELT
jgi:hypothetical protein